MRRRTKKDSLLTPEDVARLLNIHINTVRRWSNREILKAYRIGPRGDRRFRKEDITTFLIEHSNSNDVNHQVSEIIRSVQTTGGVARLV
jgi:excisionase family DNA binding protein